MSAPLPDNTAPSRQCDSTTRARIHMKSLSKSALPLLSLNYLPPCKYTLYSTANISGSTPNDPLPCQIHPLGEPIIVDGHEEWEVAKILDSRLWHGGLRYCVAWKDHPPDQQWYPAHDFTSTQEKLEEFHCRKTKSLDSSSIPTRSPNVIASHARRSSLFAEGRERGNVTASPLELKDGLDDFQVE